MDINFNNIKRIQWQDSDKKTLEVECGSTLFTIAPIDTNRHWVEIKERVDAGTLTIKDAD
tara:strand:- start:50 stop:229 length:180 start_codon:yes stop_codon:yes gene_type:complete